MNDVEKGPQGRPVLCFSAQRPQNKSRARKRRHVSPEVERALDSLESLASGEEDVQPPESDDDEGEIQELRWLRAGLSTLRTTLELAVYVDSESSAPRLDHGALLALVERLYQSVYDGAVSRRLEALEAAQGSVSVGSCSS